MSREPFLLTVGRLVPYKRVDLAVAAAERLGVRLVVVGDGPERSRLQRLAGARVEFRGRVSDDEAARLLASCAAFVFCAEEDFGIAPVEANAHGAPVVAFARGGSIETMQDGVTATFFHEQTVDAVADAIDRCLTRDWDRAALTANASRFSPDRFRGGMRSQLHAALRAPPRAG
jgi:glycosyltransferase involved in cell wall biosynthesis